MRSTFSHLLWLLAVLSSIVHAEVNLNDKKVAVDSSTNPTTEVNPNNKDEKLSNQFPNSTEIDHSNNHPQKIETNTIDPNTFDAAKNLNPMHLESNNISVFDCGIFPTKNNLTDISWNNITTFDTTACPDKISRTEIKQGKNEGILYTNSSYVIYCNKTSFKNIKTVKIGETRNLKFKYVRDLLECFGPSLEVLDISGSSVERLVDIIKNFKHLTELRAANCSIQNVTEVIRRLSNSTEVLDLSGNLLSQNQQLTKDLFTNLTNLKTVRFQCMGITKFDFNIFQAPANILKIDIAKNDLTAITHYNGTFSSIKNLSISKCQLKDDIIKNLTKVFKNELNIVDGCSCNGSTSGSTKIYATLSHLLLFLIAFRSGAF